MSVCVCVCVCVSLCAFEDTEHAEATITIPVVLPRAMKSQRDDFEEVFLVGGDVFH